jgi:hypothetical protein
MTQCYCPAGIGIRADVTAAETARAVIETHKIALPPVCKDRVKGSITIDVPQCHPPAAINICAGIITAETAGSVTKTQVIGVTIIRKDNIDI